ncbi:DUF3576 domain-containing protein [Rhodobacteraceae bacterium WD3A24]|nr:DUF3576 domain-containing protein [Rhodobacteraceae bacterium WD3A24]
MISHRFARAGAALGLATVVAACSGDGPFSGGVSDNPNVPQERVTPAEANRSSIWDLFANRDDPNTTVEVNRYIWNAALEVLDFLPVEQVDPFTGVFVTGYGTPPGGGTPYRATVHVTDPALDARALNVAVMTRSGPAGAETQRAVEDAILTRARQLRVRDLGL